jgi:drug/metabolite transporter (DMT)-like permease
MPAKKNTAAILSLLAGATVWGLIWHPYRMLAQAGVSSTLAATLTYLVACLLGLLFLRRPLRQLRPSWQLALLALAAGGCNLGYVLATVHGEVMRVLLLFYLAPLWTVLLARLLLDERLSGAGAAVIALSLAGAVVMLWQPQYGLPLPANGAEWLGMAAGLLFALTNVLIRRMDHLGIEVKSMAVFVGVVAVGMCILLLAPGPLALPRTSQAWLLLLGVGAVLLAINLIVQYGLMRAPANQAIVIFLFELVVAAVSSWLLAGESMTAKEWLGGALIVAASLLSGRLAAPRAQ